MKKILSTAFAALALSMVVVSTVDAKRKQLMNRKPSNTETTTSMREMTKDIMADANAVKAAPMDEKQAKAMALANDLMANPDIADLAQLQLERKKIGAELETARAKLTTIKTGWLFDSEEAKAQKALISKLNGQLRDKNKQIKEISKDLPKETSYAVYYGVAAVVGAIGVLSAVEYWYNGFENSYVGTGISKTKAGLSRATNVVKNKYYQTFTGNRQALSDAQELADQQSIRMGEASNLE